MRLAGLNINVQPTGIAEQNEPPNGKADELTRINAVAKLRAALDDGRYRSDASCIFIAADTVVAIDGEALGKPADRIEALMMLRQLRGRAHEVMTTVALARRSGSFDPPAITTSIVVSQVVMRGYSDAEITCYLETGMPYDRAGAYGIQDGSFSPAERVHGCYLNVVGLPLCALGSMLERYYAKPFANSHIYALCVPHLSRSKRVVSAVITNTVIGGPRIDSCGISKL